MCVYVWFSKHEIHHCKKLLWCLLVILLSLGGRRGMVFYYLWEPLKATFEFRRTTTISDSSKCSRRWKLNRFCTARFYNNCIIAPTTSWCYKLLICRTFKLNWIWQSQNVKLHSQKISFLIKKYHYLVSKTSASFTIDEKWEYRKEILLYSRLYSWIMEILRENISPPPLAIC